MALLDGPGGDQKVAAQGLAGGDSIFCRFAECLRLVGDDVRRKRTEIAAPDHEILSDQRLPCRYLPRGNQVVA